jgi:hypothetical protein
MLEHFIVKKNKVFQSTFKKKLEVMITHWTQYLPEGKRIFRDEVDKIRSMQDNIKKAKAELAQLEKEYSIKEYQLYELAEAKGYLGTEINNALDEYDRKNKRE